MCSACVVHVVTMSVAAAEDGGWQMPRMADGVWQMPDAGWQMADKEGLLTQ